MNCKEDEDLTKLVTRARIHPQMLGYAKCLVTGQPKLRGGGPDITETFVVKSPVKGTAHAEDVASAHPFWALIRLPNAKSQGKSDYNMCLETLTFTDTGFQVGKEAEIKLPPFPKGCKFRYSLTVARNCRALSKGEVLTLPCNRLDPCDELEDSD